MIPFTVNSASNFVLGVAATPLICAANLGSVNLAEKVGLLSPPSEQKYTIPSLANESSKKELGKKIEEFVWQTAVEAPIKEELIFRGLFQGVIFHQWPKFLFSTISQGHLLDSTTAKTARIALSTTIFSGMHALNYGSGVISDELVTTQLIVGLATGIAFGLIKESNLGMLGAIGAHMGNNLVACLPLILQYYEIEHFDPASTWTKFKSYFLATTDA